jgi:hypothetical protein
MRRAKGFLLTTVVVLVSAPAALAQTQQDESGGVLGQVGGGGEGGGSTLPFTGLDLVFIVIAGAALLALGLALRHRRGRADG